MCDSQLAPKVLTADTDTWVLLRKGTLDAVFWSVARLSRDPPPPRSAPHHPVFHMGGWCSLAIPSFDLQVPELLAPRPAIPTAHFLLSLPLSHRNTEQPKQTKNSLGSDLRGMVKATLVLNACVIEQLEKWCGNTLILRDKNRVQDHISVFSVLCDYNRVFFKTWAELRAQQSVWLWVILSQFLHLGNQL